MDFSTWWKNFGQFTPPCDRITDPWTLELLKPFAEQAYNAAEKIKLGELEEQFDAGVEEGIAREAKANRASGK